MRCQPLCHARSLPASGWSCDQKRPFKTREEPEFPIFGPLNNDIGSAGFNGFIKPETVSDEDWNQKVAPNEYRPGGHGTIVEESKDSIVKFLTTKNEGSPIVEIDPTAQKKSTTVGEWWVRLLSDTAFLVWGAILVILILVGHFWCRFATAIFAKVFNPQWARAATLAAYCALIALLLQFL